MAPFSKRFIKHELNELKSVFYVAHVYLEGNWKVVITHEPNLTLVWPADYNAASISMEVYAKIKQIEETFQKPLLSPEGCCQQKSGLADLSPHRLS